MKTGVNKMVDTDDDNIKLTAKQERFVDAYLGNGNATEAYKIAGYKAKNDNVASPESSKLLRNPKVSQAITRRKVGNLAEKQKKQEKYEITQDWLISQLITTIEDARADKQHNTVRNSLVDIGKLVGLYYDKKEINTQLSIDANLTSLDTGELLKALRQARQPEALEGEFKKIN
jgi:phage terminase small subunit